MGLDIQDLSRICDQDFQKVSRDLQDLKGKSHDVFDALHREFKQWTHNLSVYARPHVSLDANLQNNESLRKLILRFLNQIKRNIHRIELLINETEDYNEVTDESDSSIAAQMDQWSTTKVSSLLVESLKALQSGIESLVRLSITIQQTSESTLTQRINNFATNKDDCSLEEIVYLRLTHYLITRPREQDHTLGATRSLCRQLAASISFRYYSILGRRRRDSQKPDDTFSAERALPSTSHSQYAAKFVPQHDIPKPNQHRATKGKSLERALHPVHTAPSTAGFRVQSDISVPTSSGVRYPKAPKIVPPETSVLCPFCCDYHDQSQLDNKEWWERHVDQELRLFACISEECMAPPLIFARFDAWKQHMDAEHSRQWTSNVHTPLKWFCGEHDEHFEDEVACEQHVQAEHPVHSEGPELECFKSWCAINMPRPGFTCPICNSMPKDLAKSTQLDEHSIQRVDLEDEHSYTKLMQHIAEHLKEVGLMFADYIQDDDSVASRMSDKDNQKRLPDGTWVDGTWEPPIGPYLDDDYKDYSVASGQVDNGREEDWRWIMDQRCGIVLNWTNSDTLQRELLDCDDPEHNVRDRLALTTALGGEDHPHVIHCLAALTIVLAYKRQTHEAESVFVDALELCTQILGAEYLMTTTLIEQVAAILSNLERQDIWERILQNIKQTRLLSQSDREVVQVEPPEQIWETPEDGQQFEQAEVLRFDEQSETQLQSVQRWLRPADVETDQFTFVKSRANCPETGNWLFQNQHLKEWFDPQNATVPPFLWLSGIPGAGKTMLASLVVEKAEALKPKPTVLYFYCKRDNSERDNFIALGRTLLSQFVHQDTKILPAFHQVSSRNGQDFLSSSEVVEELLTLAFDQCKSAYIILDGLNECSRGERKIIANWFRVLLEKLPSDDPARLRCLFVSQDDGPAREDFTGLPSIQIEAEGIQNDIEEYCRFQAGKLLEDFPHLSREKVDWIASTVAKSSERLFLLARLIWTNLFRHTSIEEMEEELESKIFPGTIRDAYLSIIVRILDEASQEAREDIMRLLGWLICAKRPLKSHELRMMASIDGERRTMTLERQKSIESPADLLASLVETRVDGSLQFCHPTVKLFLLEEGYVVLSKEELNMAILCIDYLNFPAFAHPPTEIDIRNGDYGFMDYAVLFWLRHLEVGLTLKSSEEEGLMDKLAESLEKFFHQHWNTLDNQHWNTLDDQDWNTLDNQHRNTLDTKLDVPKRLHDKFQHFRAMPFYDQLGQAAASTEQQLKTFGNTSIGSNVLDLERVVYDVRRLLESIYTADLLQNNQQGIESKYGTNIFKCPRFSCQFFTTGFLAPAERDKHVSKHVRPFLCLDEMCVGYTFGFSSAAEHEKHKRENHLEDAGQGILFPTRKGSDRKPKSFKCKLCPKAFTRKINLEGHTRSHFGDRPYGCGKCDKRFTRLNDLRRHEKYNHRSHLMDRAVEEPTLQPTTETKLQNRPSPEKVQQKELNDSPERPRRPASGSYKTFERTVEGSTRGDDIEALDPLLDSLSRLPNLQTERIAAHMATPLLAHQKEAVDFIRGKESERRDPDLSLWKYNKPFYQHVLSGAKQPEPSETRGGIIADEMGLGKSLVIIYAILDSLERSKAFAAAEEKQHPTQQESEVASQATLIIVPSSLLIDNWVDQINKHVVNVDLQVHRHTGTSRHKETRYLFERAIVFTTYATVAAEFCHALDNTSGKARDDSTSGKTHGDSILGKIKWFRIVLDEAHDIRNRSTSKFRAVASLPALHRWCLTGTPIQNSLEDLGALVSFLRVPIMENASTFRRLITNVIDRESPSSYGNLHTLLNTICLRRRREDVNLPEALETTRYLSLTPSEYSDYQDLLRQGRVEIDMAVSRRGKGKMTSAFLQPLLKLRLFCNNGRDAIVPYAPKSLPRDPDEALIYLQQHGQNICAYCSATIYFINEGTENDGGTLIAGCSHLLCYSCGPIHRSEKNRCPTCATHPESALASDETNVETHQGDRNSDMGRAAPYPSKLLALLADVRGGSQEKSIVFSAWKRTLDLVGRLFTAHDIRHEIIDGSLPSSKRIDVLEKFRSLDGANILLMTLGTGAVGLNLAIASRVYLLEPQWNPSIESQAIGRVLRLGQTDRVTIIRYIMNDTIEGSNVLFRQRRKLRVAIRGFDYVAGMEYADDMDSARIEALKDVFDVR